MPEENLDQYTTAGKCPNYDVVPLECENVGVAAVQFNPNRLVDPKNPKKVIRENLAKMLELADLAKIASLQWPTGQCNLKLLVYPEFSITGMNHVWTIDDWQRIALEVPGEETEELGKKAKQLNAYIVFASHIKEKDFPGHYFNTSMIIDPNGKLIHRHWKCYRANAGYEWSTTVHDVLDRFVELYGWDAVWPVARTSIGNLATYICSEGFAPETARAYAFKGAEILCRCFSGGGEEQKYGKYMLQFRADCANSLLYGVMANARNGGSMIVDPFGRIMNQSTDCRDTIVYENIPIGWYRANHERPFIRTEVYTPALTQNPGRFPPNLYLKHGVPRNAGEAAQLFTKNARWWGTWMANR